MAFKPIIINTAASAEPHVQAQDAAMINFSDRAGMSGFMDGAHTMDATHVGSNVVRISPGAVSNQGYDAVILPGDYHDVTIEAGIAGQKRIDYIVSQVERTGDVDTHTLAVLKGAPTSGTPTPPTVQTSNLLANGTLNQLPLFSVAVTGVAVTGVTRLAKNIGLMGLITNNLGVPDPVNDGDLMNLSYFHRFLDQAVNMQLMWKPINPPTLVAGITLPAGTGYMDFRMQGSQTSGGRWLRARINFTSLPGGSPGTWVHVMNIPAGDRIPSSMDNQRWVAWGPLRESGCASRMDSTGKVEVVTPAGLEGVYIDMMWSTYPPM